MVSTLRNLAPIVSDLEAYLQAWTADQLPSALGGLAQFALEWNWRAPAEGRIEWCDAPFDGAKRKVIEAWLLAQALPALERAYQSYRWDLLRTRLLSRSITFLV